jgi:hypothetical protein
MILGDEVVGQRLLGGASHELKLQRSQRPQRNLQRRGIQQKRS